MDRRRRSKMRKKALVAVAFANGLLCIPSPALCDAENDAASSFSKIIRSGAPLSQELQAYYLLLSANKYLDGGTESDIEKMYLAFGAKGSRGSSFLWDPQGFIKPFIEVVISEKNSYDNPNTVRARPKSEKERALANSAIDSALFQLTSARNELEKIQLIFIAYVLFEKAGNTSGVQRCGELIEKSLKQCEENVVVEEPQIHAATWMLNQEARLILNVPIFDHKLALEQREMLAKQGKIKEVGPYTASAFRQSEMLRLRAVELADRLEPTDDLRRKAHRDMSLWYSQLGKREAAEKHKQILFDLVGFKDEGLLYPQPGMCGHVVWWKPSGYICPLSCGMG